MVDKRVIGVEYTISMPGLTFESKELAPAHLWLKASGDFSGGNISELQSWLAEIAEKIADMHKKSGREVSCVFDLLGAGEAKDPVVINALVEFQKINKPHIHKTSLIVKDPEVRLAMSIVGALADRYNVRSFASNQEAENWAFSESESPS
jgi:hypothetical protein